MILCIIYISSISKKGVSSTVQALIKFYLPLLLPLQLVVQGICLYYGILAFSTILTIYYNLLQPNRRLNLLLPLLMLSRSHKFHCFLTHRQCDYWNTPKGFFSLLVTCRCLSVCCVIVYWGNNKSNDSGLLLSATLRQNVDNCNWQETSPRHWDWANQLDIWRRAANLYIYLRHLSSAARTPFNMIIGHVHGHMRMADCARLCPIPF